MRVWKFLLLLVGLGLIFGVGMLAFNFLIMPRLVHRHHEVLVPSLTDRALAEAEDFAAESGLLVEVVRSDPHPTAPAGTVVDQHPDVGAKVRKGRHVAVILSDGPPAGPVPSLAGLTRNQAEATLQRESFRLGRVLTMTSPGAVAPSVAFQSPSAGTSLRKGEIVHFVVAEPDLEAFLRMPDLRGRSLHASRGSIERAGCVTAPVRYERDGSVPPNTILEQRPAPGARIPRGETIELVVSSR